jgi:hypothetical protein
VSELPRPAPADDPVIPADPALGRYLAHYPSNRLRLLLQGAALYTVPVVALNWLFAGLDDVPASIILIGSYAVIGLGIAWYVLHLWNREVILYERGFTYREGSRLGLFPYFNIVRFTQHAERVSYFNLIRREVYQARLVTDQEEVLIINNVYSSVGDLIARLESAITRDRLPIVQARLARGESVPFGDALRLDGDGLHTGAHSLAWEQFAGHRFVGKDLHLLARQGDPLIVRVADLENALLLLALLKNRPLPTGQPA